MTDTAMRLREEDDLLRTYPWEAGQEEAAGLRLPRAGWYTLADVDHNDGSLSFGLALAGPYETAEDAVLAGMMLVDGEEPDGGYPVQLREEV